MTTVIRFLERHRRAVVVLIHVALIAASSYLAIWLRFDGEIPALNWEHWQAVFPFLLLVRLITFVPFGLYHGIWRYTDLWDIRSIVAAVGVSTGLVYAASHLMLGLSAYPRSVFVIDAVILICLMTAIRLLRRASRELSQPYAERRRLLIYGAGDAGQMIVRDLRSSAGCAYTLVGFVDDDRRKVGQRIHGLTVLGTREELPALVRSTAADEVLIAIPSGGPEIRRDVVRRLTPFTGRITTLPSLGDIVNGRVTADRIRGLQLEDLLVRAPVGLDARRLTSLVGGKRILVTGAGGTIGSELAQQLCTLGPARLVLLDRYENTLFCLHQRLTAAHPGLSIDPVVADVTDARRVEEIFRVERPEIVFHAAAFKHVPLMEAAPCEAVRNNVMGTRLVATAAARHGVERFVLISTDKAVRPTSVMGATKRVAELLVRYLGQQSRTTFITVRFGNVLGSNGSVVPLFLEQIRRGGPVTLTHPDVRRYFMLIQEAVQLVLHAAAADERSHGFVLEMGEQVPLVDLARDLIRLSGFTPDRDIPLAFVGLRPGEKLIEELVGPDEVAEPSTVPHVRRLESSINWSEREAVWELQRLERLAIEGKRDDVISQLRRLVPTFAPDARHDVPGRLRTLP